MYFWKIQITMAALVCLWVESQDVNITSVRHTLLVIPMHYDKVRYPMDLSFSWTIEKERRGERDIKLFSILSAVTRSLHPSGTDGHITKRHFHQRSRKPFILMSNPKHEHLSQALEAFMSNSVLLYKILIYLFNYMHVGDGCMNAGQPIVGPDLLGGNALARRRLQYTNYASK